MPLTVKKLTDKLVPLTIKIDDDELHVVYRPSSLTPAKEAELQEHGNSTLTWARILMGLVATWDLRADSKATKDYPITEESLVNLPVSFLRDVVMGISADMVPNRTSVGSSGAGSLVAD